MDKHDIESFVDEFLNSLRRYRLLLDGHIYPPFADLERAAADQAQPEHEEWVQRRYPNPEDHDQGAAADHFNALSQRIYDDLFAMQTTLLNLFTAGLYHSFEQQMAAMCLHAGGSASATPRPTFETWAKASLGVDVTTSGGWPQILELGLVANVVKHAEGRSEQKLREIRPDVFQHPLMRDPAYASIPPAQLPTRAPLAGEDLYLIKADFDRYADAVSSFWEWLRTST